MKNISLLFTMVCIILSACTNDKSTDPTPTIEVNENATVYEVTTDVGGHAALRVVDKGEGTGTRTWYADTVYILDKMVFVNNGQTLTIQPGTIIKGMEGQGENASALIVARGGKIMAEGTAQSPIIFTTEKDNISPGELAGDNLPTTTRGEWGGLIILGKAGLNSTPGETAIEGIPTSESRGLYGGTNDTDNSGTIRYVSIRHGGTDIGAGNEINGLTFGGVGSGTTIEYVEVIANKDDGFEWFGGTVNTKYLISALCGDDAFDYDEGYRGVNQFWFVYQDAEGDRGGEHDGGTDPEIAEPYATPTIYNATFQGNGENKAITMRDNAGGYYYNSIFSNYSSGIDIEILDSESIESYSFKQLEAQNLIFANNIFTDIPANKVFIAKTDSESASAASEAQVIAAQAMADSHFADHKNEMADPLFDSFVPATDGPAALGEITPLSGSFFTSANFRGAFAPGQEKWITGWSLLNLSGEVK